MNMHQQDTPLVSPIFYQFFRVPKQIKVKFEVILSLDSSI